MRRLVTILATVLAILSYSTLSSAAPVSPSRAPLDSPILVIGASMENAKTPCVVGKVNALGCLSIGFGNYLSLGPALTRSRLTNGLVLVEAMAGATTFDRPGFIIPTEERADVGFEEYGFEKQLKRAVAAATDPITNALNARYVVIGIANDCLHSSAFLTPPSQSRQCASTDRNAVVDRYIAAGRQAIAVGLIPVYTGYPPLATGGLNNGVDLELAKSVIGVRFMISRTAYTDLANRYNKRIAAELPGAILVNAYTEFSHIGDGLHPNRRTTERAATLLIRRIVNPPFVR